MLLEEAQESDADEEIELMANCFAAELKEIAQKIIQSILMLKMCYNFAVNKNCKGKIT